MALASLMVSGVATFLAALTYAYVGTRLLDRGLVSEPARRAMGFFALWWMATATNQLLGALLYVAAALGWTDLGVQLSYAILQRLLLAASLVGLMYYLLYLFRGRGHLGVLVAAYAAYGTLQVYAVLAGRPEGVDVGRWRTDLAYAAPVPPLFPLTTLLFVVLPPVVGALALWSLYPEVRTRGQRLRISTVSAGLVTWWVVAVLAGQRHLHDVDAVQAANRILGLAVALAILLAYAPTPRMRRRLRLDPEDASAR